MGHDPQTTLRGLRDERLPLTLIVAAHPDDEVLGAGSLLGRLGGGLIVHVTDGAPRDPVDALAAGCRTRAQYAERRRQELVAALRLAGLTPEVTRQLGLVDREASFHLVELSRALAGLLVELGPALVLTHPYEGGHPDHDSAALGVQAACALLRRDGRPSPAVVEFTSYHGLEGTMRTGEFLPAEPAPPCEELHLDEEQRAQKQRMLECFTSRRRLLEAFPVSAECYRLSPGYDFCMPPHPGVLLYERFSWGMTGRLWRCLAADALMELRLASCT